MKINRTFRNAQVDGHHDHDISSGDESVASQPEQYEELPTGPVVACSAIDSIANAPNTFVEHMSVSVSVLHSLVSQDDCPNCHFFLEKMFLSSDPERVSFIMDKLPEGHRCQSGLNYYFGHKKVKCPFLDLKQPCKHCNTPGKFLKGGFHFSSYSDDRECECCSLCEFKDFYNEEMYLEGLINFLAILTIAQDSEMNLDHSTFKEEFIDL